MRELKEFKKSERELKEFMKENFIIKGLHLATKLELTNLAFTSLNLELIWRIL